MRADRDGPLRPVRGGIAASSAASFTQCLARRSGPPARRRRRCGRACRGPAACRAARRATQRCRPVRPLAPARSHGRPRPGSRTPASAPRSSWASTGPSGCGAHVERLAAPAAQAPLRQRARDAVQRAPGRSASTPAVRGDDLREAAPGPSARSGSDPADLLPSPIRNGSRSPGQRALWQAAIWRRNRPLTSGDGSPCGSPFQRPGMPHARHATYAADRRRRSPPRRPSAPACRRSARCCPISGRRAIRHARVAGGRRGGCSCSLAKVATVYVPIVYGRAVDALAPEGPRRRCSWCRRR